MSRACPGPSGSNRLMSTSKRQCVKAARLPALAVAGRRAKPAASSRSGCEAPSERDAPEVIAHRNHLGVIDDRTAVRTPCDLSDARIGLPRELPRRSRWSQIRIKIDAVDGARKLSFARNVGQVTGVSRKCRTVVHHAPLCRGEEPGNAASHRKQINPGNGTGPWLRQRRAGGGNIIGVRRPRDARVSRWVSLTYGKLAELLLRSPEQREHVNTAASCHPPPYERDLLAIRRPARVRIEVRIGRQSSYGRGPHRLDVEVEIVFVLSVPAECDLLAVGREGRRILIARQRRQRHYRHRRRNGRSGRGRA